MAYQMDASSDILAILSAQGINQQTVNFTLLVYLTSMFTL